MKWLRRLVNRYPNQLLLLLSLGVLVCFAFPQIGRLSYVFYSLIALLLTCGPAGRGHSSAMDDRLYRALGAVAVAAMWLWLITPMNLLASGVPMALSWSVLVGWSLVRMIQSLAAHAQVTRPLLLGAIAGYLHATQRASERSANEEAIRHARRGLACAETLPTGPERERQELRLQLAIGGKLRVARSIR